MNSEILKIEEATDAIQILDGVSGLLCIAAVATEADLLPQGTGAALHLLQDLVTASSDFLSSYEIEIDKAIRSRKEETPKAGKTSRVSN
jgi:hypothetical protein